MSLSHKLRVNKFRNASIFICTLGLISFIPSIRAQQPGGSLSSDGGHALAGSSNAWHSDDAVQIIGLPGIREKEKGSLSISPDAITFISPEGQALVERKDIRNVTVGGVTVEMGGRVGKVARAVIPFGGGAAVATVTHKQLSLLTVEFRDRQNALHGAVFLLPKDEAVLAQRQLRLQSLPAPLEDKHAACEVHSGLQPETIRLFAIATPGSTVPAEYKVLLYEQLVRRLRDEGTLAAVYRVGDDDPAADCAKYNLVLTVDGFKKGNAAVRASTGPIGLFVGATSVKFHVQVEDPQGRMLFDKEQHVSQRGDSDSLDIGDKIAKSLTKDLKKARGRATRT